jgi:ribosomal-protein-alanine N-acetyltransferase
MTELRFPEQNLAGDGFVLRPFTLEDVAPDNDAIEHPDTSHWLNPVSAGDPKDVFDGIEQMRTSGEGLTFTIADEGDSYLGSIVLFMKGHDTAELAYVVAPAARGRGLARGAVQLLGDWAVASLGIHRLQLCISPENAPSLRVAEACGYREEGLLREAFTVRGRREDVIMLSRLATD